MIRRDATKGADDSTSDEKKQDYRVPGSYAMRSWFVSDEAAQAHVDQLRIQEKMVDGKYVEDPDLGSILTREQLALWPDD